jgi:two-component system, response regulator
MNSILLIEDSLNDQALVSIALKRQPVPLELVVASDGLEGLEFLLDAECRPGSKLGGLPSFVMLDLKLPKIDGLEVLRRIREQPSIRAIPVVIWSSSCEIADLERAYHLGANSYIQKPTQFEEFSSAVHELTSYWLKLNRSPSSIT